MTTGQTTDHTTIQFERVACEVANGCVMAGEEEGHRHED